MKDSPYFHIGVLVPDLERAMAEFTRQHGLAFPKPAAITFAKADGSGEESIRVVYTKNGPPYYEFIEVLPGSVFGDASGGPVHHVGVWEDDMAGRVKLLRENDVAVMASGLGLSGRPGLMEDAVPHWVITEPNAFGVRYEYFDAALRPGIEMWIETGEFPGAG